MKWRKKPIVIEAYQMTEKECDMKQSDKENWPAWLYQAWLDDVFNHQNGQWEIKTLEGDHRVTAGDFIIQGVKGELYPCKPDIFEATYEPAE